MNKRILSIILTIILCMSCWVPTFAATDLETVDVFNKSIWSTDFDSFTVNTGTNDCKDSNGKVYLPKWWNTVSQIAASPVDAATHGNAMKLISGSDSSLAQINSNEAFASGRTETVWKIQQDFLFESTSSTLDYRHLNQGTTNIHNTLFSVNTSGVLSLPATATNTTNFNTYKNLSKNTWYTFTIIIDSATDKYSLYINGAEITKDTNLTTAIPKFEKLHMRFGKASSSAGFCGVYIDNFSASVQAPFTLESTSIQNNATNCSLTAPVTFTYSGNLKQLPTVTMTKEGINFTDFTASYTNNVLSITFNNPLDRITSYGIKVENAEDMYQSIIPLSEISFTTTDGLTDLERVDKYNNLIWDTDFDNFGVDSGTNNCKDSNGTVYLPSFWNTTINIKNAPVDVETHGNAMKLISGTDSTVAQINSNEAFTSGKSNKVWKLQQDFLFESTSSTITYTILNPADSGNITNTLFTISNTGVLSLPAAATNTDNFNTYKNISKNTWYTFTAIVDAESDVYSLYINDAEITKNASLTTSIDNFVKIHMRCGKASTAAGFCGVYIDNFSCGVEGNFKLESTSVANNATDCDLSLPVTFTYSRTLRRLPRVTMTKNGQNFTSFTALNSSKELTVSFDNPLERLSTYTIKVENAEDMFGSVIALSEITFTTTDVFKATEPIFTDGTSTLTQLPPTGTVEVISDFKNGSADTVNATLVMAFYDDNDNLIGISDSGTKTLNTGEHEMGVSVSATVDSYSNLSYIKAFVVDTITNLKAHNAKYAVLGKEETVVEEKATATVTLAQFSQKEESGVDFFKVTGSVSPVLQKNVLISITDTNDVVLNILPVTTTEEGEFDVSLPVSVTADTVLKIRVSGAGITNAITKDAMFVGTSRADILNAVNSATTAEEIENGLAAYTTKMAGTDSRLTVATFCDNGYQTLLENKPFTKFCDAVDIVAKAENLLYRLNNDNSSFYEEILTNNHAIILKGYENDYAAYSAKSSEEKGQIAVDVIAKGTVLTFADFRKNFSDVMNPDEVTEGEGNGGVPSLGGGGGGGGGFYGPVTEFGEKEDEGEETKQDTQDTETTPATNFTDLANYGWARESIDVLCKRGIVNGDGNGKFRPEASVTREEFIKMLVLAYDIELKNVDITFKDVKEGAWYVPYIKAAYAFGITTGENANSFGVGKNISRQDMAVMCARVLEKLGYKIDEKSELNFKDATNISEYAKDAVMKIKSIGVINGTDEGKFLPLHSAKRAEAAKIIHGLLMYCEEAK